MSLGLCLCQGAGQRVPTMCSRVGCEWVMPALSSVAACHALFKTTGKQLSHFAILSTVLFNPTCMSCAAGAHRHATPRVPAAGWGCHRCSAGFPAQHRAHARSPGALLGTALALATLTALRGAAHNACPRVLWSSRQALVPAMPCLGAKQKRRRDLTLKLPYG